MASSNVARFLRKQYLHSLETIGDSHSSDPILTKFKSIGKDLKHNRTELSDPESISWLSDLNEALTEWKKLKEQKKSIKRTFTFQDHVTKMWSPIEAKINELEKSTSRHASMSSSTKSSQPNSLKLDRYTFYKPSQVTCTIEDEVFDDREKMVVDWLVTSGDGLKAVGIYGTGGSGKTVFVKNVLNQKIVRDKFKCIIWTCLSELTCEEEMEEWIVKYLLYRLGLDVDSLVGNLKEDKDWLVEELERRLLNSGNYILVLDDMWQCNKWFTDVLLGRLKKIGLGAVIVTSRKKTMAEKFGDKNRQIHLDLNPLAHKESAILKDEDSDLGNGSLFA